MYNEEREIPSNGICLFFAVVIRVGGNALLWSFANGGREQIGQVVTILGMRELSLCLFSGNALSFQQPFLFRYGVFPVVIPNLENVICVILITIFSWVANCFGYCKLQGSWESWVNHYDTNLEQRKKIWILPGIEPMTSRTQ